jgi:hypothetical protein
MDLLEARTVGEAIMTDGDLRPDRERSAATARLRTVQARADRHEERLRRLVAELAAARRRIGELEKHLGDMAYRADRTAWQLESVRAGRWWRLGQALATGKRRPIALPAGIVRALGGGPPRPAPPVWSAAPRTGPDAPDRGTAAPDQAAVAPDRAANLASGADEPGAAAASGRRDLRSVLGVAPAALPAGPVNLPDLTAVVIHDPVTTIGLRYEWRQLDGLRPDGWRPVLASERPRLLLAGPVPGWPAAALEPLVAWCRERHIPTVYWIVDDGAHDGPHVGAHEAAARLFDRVYVADARAVPRYREARGDDRVDVLPAAAQPRVHNPIGVPDRRAFDVAGPPGALVDGMRELGPHVYGPATTAIAPRSGCHVAGDLPYETMLAARKLYKVVAGGGTREIFELAAAGVPAISRRSALVTEVFGDLVPVAVSHREAAELARLLLASAELRDRNAHLAWRAVFEGHTYRHRVATVLSDLGIRGEAASGSMSAAAAPGRPPVSVVLATCRAGNIDHAIEQVARQTWRPLQLITVLHGLDVEPAAVKRRAGAAGIDDVIVLPVDGARSLGACLNAGIEAADGAYIGKMDDDELYGPHYIADLVHAFRYTEAQIVGKLAHYVHLTGSGANILRYPELEHTYVDLVRGGALLAAGDLLRAYRFDDVTRGEDTRLFRRCRADGVKIYSADRFSFVMVRHRDAARHTWQVSDRALMADGRIAFYGPPHEHVLI